MERKQFAKDIEKRTRKFAVQTICNMKNTVSCLLFLHP
jgi:hypothetical protein